MHRPVLVRNGWGNRVIVIGVGDGACEGAEEVFDGLWPRGFRRFDVGNCFAMAGDGESRPCLFNKAEFFSAVSLELGDGEAF